MTLHKRCRCAPEFRASDYLGLLVNALGWALAFRAGMGVLLTALLVALVLALSGKEFVAAAKLVVFAHLPVMAIEAVFRRHSHQCVRETAVVLCNDLDVVRPVLIERIGGTFEIAPRDAAAIETNESGSRSTMTPPSPISTQA